MRTVHALDYLLKPFTAARLHERSRFVREGERWYYLDGDLQQPLA